MDCSVLGSLVLHFLPVFAQFHVHRVSSPTDLDSWTSFPGSHAINPVWGLLTGWLLTTAQVSCLWGWPCKGHVILVSGPTEFALWLSDSMWSLPIHTILIVLPFHGSVLGVCIYDSKYKLPGNHLRAFEHLPLIPYPGSDSFSTHISWEFHSLWRLQPSPNNSKWKSLSHVQLFATPWRVHATL